LLCITKTIYLKPLIFDSLPVGAYANVTVNHKNKYLKLSNLDKIVSKSAIARIRVDGNGLPVVLRAEVSENNLSPIVENST
jgi:hypothetical protein